MKRVPVYLSVEEMQIIREGLSLRPYLSMDEVRVIRRLDSVLEEEIERNTEPGEVSNG